MGKLIWLLLRDINNYVAIYNVNPTGTLRRGVNS